MSIASKGLSAISRLAAVALLLGAFGIGMTSVVYMSLSGTELKVPEVVGKDFYQTEKEMAALGLKLHKKADRPSAEPMNEILEQLPKPGETVKTGQMIIVVVSSAGLEGEPPPPLPPAVTDKDDSEKIEEMISEKPKKAKTNTNSNKKKADTTRDTLSDPDTISNSNSNKSNDVNVGDKKDSGTTPASGDKNDKDTKPAAKPAASPGPVKPAFPRPPRSEPPSRQ